MYTIKAARGVTTGAEHRRAERPGQDAAVVRIDGSSAVAVVCDGCGSTPHAHVGAELGARWWARAIMAALGAGADPATIWAAARTEVVARIAAACEALGGDPLVAIHDLFLFTVVAAAVSPAGAAVYAIGDGGYVLGERTTTLGPFADNQPPYVAYDLLGDPRAAVLATAPAGAAGAALVATDGATALDLAALAADAELVTHPDALRRRLALGARGTDRIDWDARRVVHTPALLRDDAAVAILRWEAAP